VKIKWPEPPAWMMNPLSWQKLRWINFGTATFCISLAIISGPTWLAMMNMAIAGFLFASHLWIGRYIEIRKVFDKHSELLDAVLELNGEMIARETHRRMKNDDGFRPSIH